MKIAFPSQEDKGMESPVFGHFGTARYFIVVDSVSSDTEILSNTDIHHLHGQCQPLKALGGHPVDAVVVGGIGGGALRKLLSSGIKVYRAVQGSVAENLSLIQSSRLPEFDLSHTCAGHDNGQACAH